eukprot:scaffold9191_cov114-Isochrysis_galbana.AAC.10
MPYGQLGLRAGLSAPALGYGTGLAFSIRRPVGWLVVVRRACWNMSCQGAPCAFLASSPRACLGGNWTDPPLPPRKGDHRVGAQRQETTCKAMMTDPAPVWSRPPKQGLHKARWHGLYKWRAAKKEDAT